ncbi:MAG TPA: radical SAM protein, partial [Vicinamibacterales bacterium]|nr:radical SAM protein [Vicinamibacterales bacterium]
RPLYDFLTELPDLQTQPLPKVSPRLQKKFAVRGYGTIDAGRGCPFNCSFCTIINVQGHAMRSRGAEHIAAHIRAHYRIGRTKGIRNYFFTDDNFSRNPSWEAIFDALIALRRDEGVAVDFMMQVDTAATRLPGFVEKAARAGCAQVFIGMESLRADNLEAACKRQNRVDQYRESLARWHEAGIVCHVGFIIGFPFDTYERIQEDVRTLRDELHVDQASFFMLTPLPGSRDHRAAVDAGAPMDPDYNNFDSFRAAMPHPRMSTAEWTAAYRDAWTSFYSFDHMRRALLRQNPHTYWRLFKCFLWYRASMLEGSHPMVTGFYRLKDRRSRRPGLPIEGRVRFFGRRLRETAAISMAYAKLLRELGELWQATRIRRDEYGWIGDLRALRTRATTVLDVKATWARAHAVLAARLRDWNATSGEPVFTTSEAMHARLEAVRKALGHRADELVQAAAGFTRADIRVPSLPPLRPRWAPRPLSRPTSRPRARPLDARRANPWTWVRDAARDVREVAVFVANMTLERY